MSIRTESIQLLAAFFVLCLICDVGRSAEIEKQSWDELKLMTKPIHYKPLFFQDLPHERSVRHSLQPMPIQVLEKFDLVIDQYGKEIPNPNPKSIFRYWTQMMRFTRLSTGEVLKEVSIMGDDSIFGETGRWLKFHLSAKEDFLVIKYMSVKRRKFVLVSLKELSSIFDKTAR